MKIKTIFWLIIMLSPSLISIAERVRIPGGIDHTDFDRLLKTYVDGQGLVDYERWKNSAEDLTALDSYLGAYAPKPETEAAGNERWAGLINAYNAFTLQWILKNYPTESIRLLDESFDKLMGLITGLSDEQEFTGSLFDDNRGRELVSQAVDRINAEFGKNSIHLGNVMRTKDEATEKIAFQKTELFSEGKGDND